MIDLRKRAERTVCKICNKRKNQLSKRGICPKCSTALNQDAISQIRVKRGPVYEKWKTRISESLERN